MKRFNIALVLYVGLSACSDTSLEGTFVAQARSDGVAGFDIIHAAEHGELGFVMATQWTDDYPESRNKPLIGVFELRNNRWQSRPGIGCPEGGDARLSIGSQTLICGVLGENRPFARLLVGEAEAQLFPITGNRIAWYAVSEDMGAGVTGINANGARVELRGSTP